jgi:hypothetical protein
MYWVIQNDCGQVWQLHMYENVCGNCVNGVEFCMTFHKRAFDLFNSIAH